MGIFSRIGDLLKANINDLIDRAEDPEKMVKQIISDLQKDVQQSTQALGKAMASERIAKRQYENAVKTSADWEAKAKAALAAGDVDLAKKALSHKVSADAEVESYQKMYEQIAAQRLRHSARSQAAILRMQRPLNSSSMIWMWILSCSV